MQTGFLNLILAMSADKSGDLVCHGLEDGEVRNRKNVRNGRKDRQNTDHSAIVFDRHYDNRAYISPRT